MSELLVLYVCSECGDEYYFEFDSLPGGSEHCEYCEDCCGILIESQSRSKKCPGLTPSAAAIFPIVSALG